MQFRDLKTQYKELKKDIDSGISNVLEDCNFISGGQVSELEKELSEYVGTKFCVTCGNGTDALSMMMMAWGVKEGDAVFVPDFTFFASAEVVAFAGATPVFYDVNADTYNADPASLERAIQAVLAEGKLIPKVIIAVDLFGQPADYRELSKIAKKYDLYLLEDGAQGFGGKIGEKRACSFGDAATTSFFPAKPLGCYGDGGAIFTNDEKTAKLLQSLRVHGKGSFKYDNVRIGWNSRLDTLQAAVLQVKLEAFKRYELQAVNEAAVKYNGFLGETVKIPVVPDGFYSSWAQYTIQVTEKTIRDDLQGYLKENGIPSMVYYPKPMHLQTAFHNLHQYEECKTAEKLCDTVVSLPMHPYLQEKDIEQVSKHVKDFLG